MLVHASQFLAIDEFSKQCHPVNVAGAHCSKEKQDVVVYRSKLHATLKRNSQVMPGAAWLELLLQHVPDRGEHLVRYYGWYSNRSRGE